MRPVARAVIRLIPIPFTLLLLASGVAWWTATGRLIAEAAAWRQARLAEGYVVAAGEPQRGGWPLRAVVTLPAVVVATDNPGLPVALTLRADAVRLVYAPWRPGVLALVLDGALSVQAGAAQPLELTAGRLDVDVRLPGFADAGTLTIAAADLRLAVEAGTAEAVAAEAGAVRLRLRGAEAELVLSRLMLPGHALPFGEAVSWLELHASSTVPIPALREPRAALAVWRDAGGVLRLDGMSLRWGKLDMTGRATLGLDAALQPEGTGTIRLTGFADVVGVLVQSGALTRNDGRVATTLLALVSGPASDAPPQAELPMTLRDRVLSAGAVPLLRLPMLSPP